MNYTYGQNPDNYPFKHEKLTDFAASSALAQNIICTLREDYRGSTAIRLWNNRELHSDSKSRCALVFKQLRMLAGIQHLSPSTCFSGHPRYPDPVQSPSLWRDIANSTPIATNQKYSPN
jgi:hypothetical protein